jgi:hypothetical protein
LTHFFPKAFSVQVNGKYEELDIHSNDFEKKEGKFHYKRKVESLVEEVKSRRSLEQRILNEAEQQKEIWMY